MQHFEVPPCARAHREATSIHSALRGLFGGAVAFAILITASGPVHGQGFPDATSKSASRARVVVPPVAPPSAGTSASVAAALMPNFVPGYLLVQPKAGLPRGDFDKALATQGGRAIGKLDNLDVYVVSLPPSASEKAVAHALLHHPHIKYAEPDALVRADYVPNDTYYASEWHLTTIDAPTAWNIATGSGVTVAILDSGIDAGHPDLAGQLVAGWNYYDNNSNTADVYGHGTKVAGVVGALGNNSAGVAGVAFNAKLMPVRVTDTNGWASISALANGLTYAADHGARVANMSFAVQSYSTVISAAQYFTNKGGIVMNSAGNTGASDSTAPSGALVSVSATDAADNMASFSSFGPYVDVAAPGAGIWTTTMGGGYGAVSGTSFSSPLTAGVAALMLSANPRLTPTQVVGLLESSAVDFGTTGYDYYFGNGRVNAGTAVAAAAAGAAPVDTQAPAVAISSPAGGTVSGIVPVGVDASDNVGVARVELLVNGSVLAADTLPPYAFSWDSSSLAGNVSLVARAYDAAGNAATSKAVAVNVANVVTPDTTPPSVSIASPTGGTVSGVVSVSINASDNVGVTRVELLADGAVVGSDTASPFAVSWDSASSAGTSPTLTVRAYDGAGNSAVSQSVTVAVASGTPPSGPDTTPPAVSIDNPANGSKAAGMVNITVSATDNTGVASMALLIDGGTVASGNGGSVAYKWNARKSASGTHTITAWARDAAGNQSTTTIQVIR